MTDTLTIIYGILKQNYAIEVPLDPGTPVNELGIDSVDLIGFLFELEERTGVKIPDENLNDMAVLGDYARFIDAHRRTD